MTPLDPTYGADEIDVNQSHWILTSCEQAGSATPAGAGVGQRGWDVFTLEEAQSLFWRFEVASQKPVVDAALTWNRLVPPGFSGWFSPNLNLRLWGVDSGGQLVSLVGDSGLGAWTSGNVESVSLVDNVELLHLSELVPGSYALEVWRAIDYSFLPFEAALAWNMLPLEPSVYCSAKLTSNGCLPGITVQGVPSASDSNPFLVAAQQVLNNKNGLLFYGFAPAAAPFLGGTLCVQPPLRRTALQSSGGSPPPDDCSGSLTFDMRGQIQSGVDPFLLPGTAVFAQYWFRDPQAASGSGLTDGLEFTISQ